MKALKIIALAAAALFIGYLSIGYLLHRIVFPEKLPDVATYFREGDILRSEWEGFTQQVVQLEADKVYCTLTIDPYAPGPPLHIHRTFDERFESFDRPLSLRVGRDTIVLQPGESYLIPRGTPHKPFNPTGDTIRLTMEPFAFPETFAFALSQVYGYFDESEANQQPPRVLLQMALFNQYFDSYRAEGAPPVAVQRAMNFLLVPMARGLGYRSWYERYGPQR